MTILSQTPQLEKSSLYFMYRDVAFLQTPYDCNLFEHDLCSIIGLDSLDGYWLKWITSAEAEINQAIDDYLSSYDYTTAADKPLTFGEVFCSSMTEYFETLNYLVIADIFGNYAIYRKAWR